MSTAILQPPNTSFGLVLTGPDLIAVTYPKASTRKFAKVDFPLSVYEGNFDLIATFRTAPNAPLGPGTRTATLRYQLLDEKANFLDPKTAEITIPYEVQPGTSAPTVKDVPKAQPALQQKPQVVNPQLVRKAGRSHRSGPVTRALVALL